MVLALWWAFKWHLLGEDARVALSAASFNQVKDIAWREIRAAYKRTPILQQVCIKPPSLDPATGLTFTSGNQIFGFSAKEAENAAGISSPHVMYLLDEASGIQDAVFSAMEGNMAGGAKMVMASQGTKMSGHFFDAFNKYRASWHCIKISSWDSPNVTGEVQIPGLATKKWCQQKKDQWGEVVHCTASALWATSPAMEITRSMGLKPLSLPRTAGPQCPERVHCALALT